MPTKISIANNPHVYQRKKHFKRRQSHQPKLQKEEEQQNQEPCTPIEEDKFYYRQNQELINKEKAVKKAQLALLKMASLENQEEEQKPDWSNQISFPKHKVNFLKQLGNYMEDRSTANFFSDDSAEMKPVSKINSYNAKQKRGISLDAKVLEKNKNSSSPQKLNIYDKKVCVGALKADLQNLDQNIFQKRSERQARSFTKYDVSARTTQQQEQQSQIRDNSLQFPKKNQEMQCLVIPSVNSQITNREQTIQKNPKEISNTLQITQKKELIYSSIPSTLRYDTSTKPNSNTILQTNPKQSSLSILENESQGEDHLCENDDNLEQSSDSARLTPVSQNRKKSHQYQQSIKRYFHESDKEKNQINDISISNSMTKNNSNGKNYENIIKMKPFVISMLQNSTMISNNRNLSGLENTYFKDEEAKNKQKDAKQSFINPASQYLKTNQSDRSASNNIINKSVSYFNSIEDDDDDLKYFSQKKKAPFQSEKKQNLDRPKTSSIYNKYQYEQEFNQQSKDKILNIIYNTNQNSLIQNQFGGVIINHPQFSNLDNQYKPKNNAKENKDDSDMFIKKGDLQNKNKMKMINNRQENLKRYSEKFICNTSRQNQQNYLKQINYDSLLNNLSNPICPNTSASTERSTVKSSIKQNRAVTIGKARNSVINKNNLNNSLNTSFNGSNSIQNNNIFQQPYYSKQQIFNNQFTSQRNNFLGLIEYSDRSNKKNNILK